MLTEEDLNSIESYLYSYKGKEYPFYLKTGNATQYVIPFAEKLCIGEGIDIGSGDNHLPWAVPWDKKDGHFAEDVQGNWDFIFSSHCLEHVRDPVGALEHWSEHLKEDGVLFLYLPHPDMKYWLPQNNRKHLHMWYPEDMVKILEDLYFKDIIFSERDLNWSYSCVCRNRFTD